MTELVECEKGIFWLGWTQENGFWWAKTKTGASAEGEFGVIGDEALNNLSGMRVEGVEVGRGGGVNLGHRAPERLRSNRK